MKFHYVLSLLIVVQCSSMEEMLKEWNEFKATYDKTYSAVEDEFRMQIFWENKLKIKNHNELYEEGKKTYFMAVNEYSDWLAKEKQARLLGPSMELPKISDEAKYFNPSNTQIPKSIDWRDYGYVNPVKNQGQCGSCWAFSSISALESQYFKKTGKLISLSEQNLVDCSTSEGNNGCGGGSAYRAYKYILNNKGVDTEEAYPYEGKDLPCRFKRDKIGATITGYEYVPQFDETMLAEAVATVGPISIAIDANDDFHHYKGGVFYSDSCSKIETNHLVVIVGYDTDKRGGDYWTVRNSWGTNWGEDGYIKMARNRNNNCAVASYPIYPVV